MRISSSLTDKQFAATATTDGLVLEQQWNHFFLQSAVEGALTLIVTSTCWGDASNCQQPQNCGGAGQQSCDLVADSAQRLYLYAQPSTLGAQVCPNVNAENKGNPSYPGTGLRLDTTICTSSDSVYSVAVRGGNFPAAFQVKPLQLLQPLQPLQPLRPGLLRRCLTRPSRSSVFAAQSLRPFHSRIALRPLTRYVRYVRSAPRRAAVSTTRSRR